MPITRPDFSVLVRRTVEVHYNTQKKEEAQKSSLESTIIAGVGDKGVMKT